MTKLQLNITIRVSPSTVRAMEVLRDSIPRVTGAVAAILHLLESLKLLE